MANGERSERCLRRILEESVIFGATILICSVTSTMLHVERLGKVSVSDRVLQSKLRSALNPTFWAFKPKCFLSTCDKQCLYWHGFSLSCASQAPQQATLSNPSCKRLPERHLDISTPQLQMSRFRNGTVSGMLRTPLARIDGNRLSRSLMLKLSSMPLNLDQHVFKGERMVETVPLFKARTVCESTL